ncbi:MAG: alcohol dehydrogenase catalytic domain-containing protein [Sneathiella sp.]|nr:alcohol dehydrogenase catalytic domain-containing protein [Sneathiella sp.]
MRCQQVIEFGKPLETREYETPTPQGTEVLIKISACGVCHSDLHLWEGYFDMGGGQKLDLAERGMKLPFTMGHEIVGEVIAIGPDAKGANIGDKRIVFPWIGCRDCARCEDGDELLCMSPQTLGTRYNGGYSDEVIAPHPKYLIPFDGIPAELACTYACSGLTAYSALKKLSHLGSNDTVVIIGAGGVGLSAVHFAPSMIKCKIVVADIDKTKRAAALDAGASAVFDNSDPNAIQKMMELTKGGAGAVIDFVGAPSSANFGLNILRKGGTLVVVGLFGSSISLPLPTLPLMMRSIIGSYVGTLDEMHELMVLVQAGKIAPIPYQVRPMEEANASLLDLKAGNATGRIVLTP